MGITEEEEEEEEVEEVDDFSPIVENSGMEIVEESSPPLVLTPPLEENERGKRASSLFGPTLTVPSPEEINEKDEDEQEQQQQHQPEAAPSSPVQSKGKDKVVPIRQVG